MSDLSLLIRSLTYTKQAELVTNNNYSAYSINLSKKINTPNSLRFNIPCNAPHYSKIIVGASLIEFEEEIYIVRSNKITKDDNSIAEISCEHLSSNLAYIKGGFYEYQAEKLSTLVNEVLKDTNWSLGETDISDSNLRHLISSGETVLANLLMIAENFGAVCIFTSNNEGINKVNFYVNKKERGFYITNTKNMQGFTLNYDTTDCCNRIWAFGSIDKTTGLQTNILSLTNNKGYVEDFSFYTKQGYSLEYIQAHPEIFLMETEMTLDDVSDEKTLYDLAIKELDKRKNPKTVLNVNVLDLSQIPKYYMEKPDIYENAILIDETLNLKLEATIIGFDKNYDDDLGMSLDISDTIEYSSFMSDIIDKVDKNDTAIKDIDMGWKDVIEQGRNDLTDMINSGLGGYVLILPDEILIMDKPKREECQAIWRINKNGIAFSPNGYHGQYTTGIDMLGRINASMVTTGSLQAEIIKTGILSSLDNSSWLNLDTGEFNFANKIKFIDDKFSITLGSGENLDDKLGNVYEKDEIDDKLSNIDVGGVYNVILSNEAQVISTDANRYPLVDKTYTTTVTVYKGTVDVTSQCTINPPTTANGIVVSKTGNNVINFKVDNSVAIGSSTVNDGIFDISVVINGNTYKKQFSWALSKQGQNGSNGQDGVDGKDGTSVTILGSYTLDEWNAIKDTLIPTAKNGDGYLVDGILYVFDGTTFVNCGNIKGEDGADAQFVVVTGEQVFKYTNNFTGTPAPTNITLSCLAVNISNPTYQWSYKIPGNSTVTDISGATSSTYNISYNNSIWGSNKQLTFRCTSNGIYDEMTVIKVSDGQDGENAKYVIVTGEQVFKYTNNFTGTPAPASITLKANANGFTTPTYQWYYSIPSSSTPTIISGATSDTYAITHNNSIWGTNKQLTFRCVVGSVYDEITVVKVSDGATGSNGQDGVNGIDGKDAYTVLLTNENHTFIANSTGNVETAITTATSVIAFKGATSITPTIGTLPNVTGLTLSKSGSTVTIVANTGTTLADNGSFNIPVTVDGISFTKTFSWSKSRNGQNGTNGSNGIDAKYLIVTGEQSFRYTNNFTGTPTPSSITINASVYGMSSPTYQWSYKTPGATSYTDISGATSASYTVTHNNSIWGTNKQLTFRCFANGISDEITLIKVSDGANGTDGTNGSNGTDGADAYTVILTNEAHAFPTENNGSISTAVSTTTSIIAYKGATVVTPSIGTLPTVSGLTLGKSGTTVTIQANTGTSLADNGSFDIPITADGKSFTKTFSWSKAKKGNTGQDGVNGANAYTVILSNESHSIVCNSSGTPNTGEIGSSGRANSDIMVYKGATKLTAVAESSTPSTNQFKYSIGTVTNGTAARTDNDTFYLNTITSNSASIPISINIENLQTITKTMSITKSIAGQDGTNGSNGADGSNASYVVATPSSLFFKCLADSTTYTPSSIKITPVFVNSSYSNWQYSIDGGTTWSNVTSGSNGLTIASNVLTIANTSSLFTSSITSISFKVSGSNNTSDICTIVKLKDGNNGANGSNGSDGVSVTSVDVEYYLSTSNSSLSGGSWSTTSPTWVSGKYMWSRTKVNYSVGNSFYSNAVCITGQKGQDGSNGSDGNGIKSIVEQYYLSTSKDSVTGGTWVTTPPIPSKGQYVWTRSIITYTDNTTTTTNPIRATGDMGADGSNGSNGSDGKDSVSILLSNENHTFIATSNGNAVASNISINIYGYIGTTLSACTIGTISGTPTGMTITKNNSGTTSSNLSIAITTSLNTKNGVITIPITCGGITVNKIFTYSLAVAGSDGSNGSNGTNAKSVDILPSSQIFKSTDGGLNFSPSTITLNTVLQNVTYSKWQYSTNGGTSWADVVSGSNGLTISSGILTISKDSNLYTSAITSIVFKLITNDSSIYDTCTISKLYDVSDLEIGGRNLIRNSSLFKGSSYWSLATNVSIDTEMRLNGYSSIKSAQTGLTSDNWRGGINRSLPDSPISMLAGETYTYSVWYYVADKTTFDSGLTLELKGKKSGSTSESGMGSISVSSANIEVGKWTRIYKTITLSEPFTEVCYRFWVQRNGTAWFSNFKLERGNKVTDFTPSVEDILDNIYDSVDNLDKQVTEKYTASIDVMKNRITSEVSETYTTKDMFTKETQSLSSKVDQTAKDITNTFTSKTDLMIGDLQAYKEEVSTNIRFSSDGIDIGKTNSNFKMNLSNTALQFKDNNTVVAEVTNKRLDITDGKFKNSMAIGRFEFRPDDAGNLTLCWVNN